LHRLSEDEQRAVLQAEGLSASETNAFLHEATERALGDFLENPQNLIMLQRAVQTGRWPATRKQLFELSTQLMLQEFDKNHTRSGAGIYTVSELRPVAGAACAARLISDIEAISLLDHEGSAEIPSYRTLRLVPRELTIAALGRRVFVSSSVPESVDYAHRTTAEYLGAAWLAQAVQTGMPLNRLQALMGIDGHPAPELRGLHAWLAVHLPEHADRLIESDPYGVLTYGDAASLSKSSCAYLIRALARLSQTDPWFRSGNWDSQAIGALARADMVEEFRTVLQSSDAGQGVRSIVVEAAALGAPIPALKDVLVGVLTRSQSPYSERLHAMIALLRIGQDGKAAAVPAFHKLGTDVDALRLRAQMIYRLYGEGFGPTDVIRLVADVSTTGGSATGVLYQLSECMPLGDLQVVLDGLRPVKHSSHPRSSDQWEVERFIERLLVRAWGEIDEVDAARFLKWLRLQNSYSRDRGRQSEHLRSAMLTREDRLSAITDHFFDTLVADNDRWLRLARFREARPRRNKRSLLGCQRGKQCRAFACQTLTLAVKTSSLLHRLPDRRESPDFFGFARNDRGLRGERAFGCSTGK